MLCALASDGIATPPINSREFRAALDTFVRRSQIERTAKEKALLRHFATIARWHADANQGNAGQLILASARTSMASAEKWALRGRNPMTPFYAAPTRIAEHEIVVFANEALTVTRILDSRRAIVTWSVVEHRGGYFKDRREGQPSNYRPPRRRTIDTTFLVAGIDTYRLAEGEPYNGPRKLYVSGEASFGRSSGMRRTMPMLEPIDLGPHELRFTGWDRARTWETLDGGFREKAVLSGFANGRVALIDRHGIRRTFDLEEFDADERRRIQEWRRTNDPILLASD